MVFSSLPFVFFFLPLCLILYYLAPRALKNYVLLFFSLVFYAWGEPVYVFLMLFVTAVDYTAGRLMQGKRMAADLSAGAPADGAANRAANAPADGAADRASDGRDSGNAENANRACRRILFTAVAIDLLCLGFFKYADFLVRTLNWAGRTLGLGAELPLPGIALPIGISFFTFQSMSYTVDVYRRDVPAENNYLTYLTYVSMFPQLIAGPIVRFRTVSEELHGRVIDRAGFEEGMLRFLRGLFRKVLIANSVGAVWEELKALQAASPATFSVGAAWLGALCFTLQLYFDFSAYSDMAIGMGRMLGFHFLENFNYPLSAVSVTDFWRRWHISLSTWFRDYVYIPLGGNRQGRRKQLRNMSAVWFLTGLWHGASWNFVLWGLYYGVLLALEKFVWGARLEKLPRIFRHLYALFIIVFGYVIFVFDDTAALCSYLRSLFGLGAGAAKAGVAGAGAAAIAAAGNPLLGPEFFWYLGEHKWLLLTALVLSFPVYPKLRSLTERIAEQAKRGDGQAQGRGGCAALLLRGLTAAGYLGLFLLSTAWMVAETYNPFLYFRF